MNSTATDGYLTQRKLKLVYAALTAIAGWFALLLQFPITIHTSRANGMTMIGAAVTYFSFFTILTNLLVAIGLVLPLLMPNSGGGRFFSQASVTSALAAYIAMVGIAYSLLLRHLWNPEGLQKIVDVVLHDAVPVMYVGYWLFFVPKTALRWKEVLWWLIYPLAYLSFVLIRGSVVGRYPYPFIDAGALAYLHVFVNSLMLVCGFLGISLLVVAISRWRGQGRLSHAA